MKTLVLVVFATTFLNAGDSFLEGVPLPEIFSSLLTILMLMILPIVLIFFHKKSKIIFFIVLILNISVVSYYNYIHHHTPRFKYNFQESYTYGIYEDWTELVCLKDRNITNFSYISTLYEPVGFVIDNNGYMLDYATNNRHEWVYDKLSCTQLPNTMDVKHRFSVENGIGKYTLIDASRKQFTMIDNENKKFETTYLQHEARYVVYADSLDLVFVVYENITGLHVLKNIYGNGNENVQEVVGRFIRRVVTSWWEKPDFNQINISNDKLEKFIKLFDSNVNYINDWTVIDFSVLGYDGNISKVKVIIDERNMAIFKLEKNDAWHVSDIEFHE